MKEKKNIDRLFQERFRNFEVQPDDKVWAGIDARRKKKKSVVIPLWFKLGSAAAAFILILLLSDIGIFGSNPENERLVEEQNQPKEPGEKKEIENKEMPEAIADRDDYAQKRNSDSTTGSSSSKGADNSYAKNPVVSIQKTGTSENNEAGKYNLSTKNSDVSREESFAEAKQNSELQSPKLQRDSMISTPEKSLQKPEKAYALIEHRDEISAKNKDQGDFSLDEIAARKEADLTEEIDENKILKRWAVSPVIAPVYYGNFGGSGIDPQFSDNKKTGDVNLSYGLQVSFAINDKLTLRSGVNRVDLGYNTEQVAFSTNIRALSISSINYAENSDILQVADVGSRAFGITGGEISNLKTNYNASLNQRLGYVEVPLEAEYTLVDKRFGIQLIGGVSTLFLADNEIFVSNENFRSLLGESNSLNDTSFSTNVGLGMDYQISKIVRFNLEPMFKYQLNAYNNTVNGFRPYYLGLYTGISVQF